MVLTLAFTNIAHDRLKTSGLIKPTLRSPTQPMRHDEFTKGREHRIHGRNLNGGVR